MHKVTSRPNVGELVRWNDAKGRYLDYHVSGNFMTWYNSETPIDIVEPCLLVRVDDWQGDRCSMGQIWVPSQNVHRWVLMTTITGI